MAEENPTPQTEIEETEEPLEDQDILEDEDLAFDADEEGEAQANANTITFKRSHLYAMLLPLAFVIGLAAGYIFWGGDSDVAAPAPTTANANAPQAEGQAPQPVTRYDIPEEDDDPVWGSDEAPVTIIEFSDYECPYCRRWHLEVWPQIQEAYGDQIRLVYRDFPLTSIHANATPAAAAANCAGEQGLYWAFSERLFSMELGLSPSAYDQYATELALDIDTFKACLESGDQNDEIMADYEYAANLGVRSTPTFFINGIPVVGAQPFEAFQSVIEEELAAAP
jgi:protein-disulfide isomerase